MTSDCDPAGAGESSSSCTSVATCRPLALFRDAEPVALRAEVRVLVPDFRAAILGSLWSYVRNDALLMNGLVVASRRVILVTGAFHERTQIIECDAPVDLGQRTFDDVLEVRGAQRATTI